VAAPEEFHGLAERAAPALRSAIGGGVRVAAVEPLKAWERNRVARLRLEEGSAPPSVIVKEILADDSLGFTDWASLEYVAAVPGAAGVAPRFLAGDVAARLFVMEDLGGSRSVDDVMREPSRAAAVAALAGLARATAQLHAATARDGDAPWAASRGALPAAWPGRAAEGAAWSRAAGPALEAWLASLGARAPAGLAGVLRALAESYAEPGPWLAFTHGDPAPSNSHVAADGTVRLLDFEYGAPRHALHDVTAWSVLCPLPADALAAVRAEYRAALGDVLPSDDASFDAAWATAVAWRAVRMLQWIGPDVLAADAPWVERWTRREAALAVTSRLHDETAAVPSLAPLADAAHAIAAALRARFPEYEGCETIPQWKAFER